MEERVGGRERGDDFFSFGPFQFQTCHIPTQCLGSAWCKAWVQHCHPGSDTDIGLVLAHGLRWIRRLFLQGHNAKATALGTEDGRLCPLPGGGHLAKCCKQVLGSHPRKYEIRLSWGHNVKSSYHKMLLLSEIC